MSAGPTARQGTPRGLRTVDWLGAARRSAQALRGILGERPTTAQRALETGTRGEGGDRTLVIDAAAEDAIFAELQRLHDDGARFTAISEERGVVEFGSPDLVVIIDPIDGSINAKRGLTHVAVSIAVADGPTMADVFFGYVHDFGPDEEWVAWRGGGAFRNGELLPTEPAERRTPDGRLEVIGIESTNPRWVRGAADALADAAYRVRAVGTIAVSMCQVAAARFDGMATIRNCRAVDAAAAQLIVRESGGHVSFIRFDPPLAAPLDVEARSPVVAARTAEWLEALSRVPL